MVDMGFLPQVEWVLRRLTGPRQTLLFSATLAGEIDQIVRTYAKDPVRHEVASKRPTVEAMEHRFFKVHQMDKLKVAAAVASGVGRTHGRFGLDEMVRVKYVDTDRLPGMKKVWWHGYGESFRRQMEGFLDMQFGRGWARMRGAVRAAGVVRRKRL